MAALSTARRARPGCVDALLRRGR